MFNWKPVTNEIHVHQHESSLASKALMVGTGVAVGAAALWGVGQMLSTKTETTTTASDGSQQKVEEEVTHVSAKVQLELLRNKRRQLS